MPIQLITYLNRILRQWNETKWNHIKKQDNIENQTPIIQNVDDNEGGTSRSKRGRISPEDDLEAKAMKPKKPQ